MCVTLALSGCSHKLDEQRVREFVDAADQAFLKGNAPQICRIRAADFRLESTGFELAKGKIVDSLADAEEIDAQSSLAGSQLAGKTEVMDVKQFCLMAIESKAFFKRATLQRSDLHIELDPAGQRATVRAHYTVKEPVYENGESALHDNDSVEHQVATRQTESDDESVIIIDPDGDLAFQSTRSISKSFLVAKERDRRL
jgi:hypothetical protein